LRLKQEKKKISLEEVALKSDEMKKYLSEKEIRRDCDKKRILKMLILFSKESLRINKFITI
jgi:hypothetical protein